jgi:hypothetical protein
MQLIVLNRFATGHRLQSPAQYSAHNCDRLRPGIFPDRVNSKSARIAARAFGVRDFHDIYAIERWRAAYVDGNVKSENVTATKSSLPGRGVMNATVAVWPSRKRRKSVAIRTVHPMVIFGPFRLAGVFKFAFMW